MGGRGRAALKTSPISQGGRAKRGNAVAVLGTRRDRPAPRPLLYTAQDLARFCEVDLKTIHHWADAGKIPHHRTEGRHLRFRRNHVLAFLRRHGYPVHAEIASARPTVFLAVPALASSAASAPSPPPPDEIARKLSTRFFVRRFESALSAIAHLVAEEPDVLVVALDDATWAGARAIRELKTRPETSWTTLVVVTASPPDPMAREAGADLVIASEDVSRLNGELARALAVD